MATRSYILKEEPDGQYRGVYCHNDGYPTYNGAMLLDHYNTEERVDQLLSMGNISVLDCCIDPYPGIEHDFEKRQDGVSLFYKRDGKSSEDESAQYVSIYDIDDPESWIEYCYIFGLDGRWKYFKCGELNHGFKDLEKGLEEEYKSLGFPRPDGYYGFYTEEDRQRFLYDYKKSQQQEM